MLSNDCFRKITVYMYTSMMKINPIPYNLNEKKMSEQLHGFIKGHSPEFAAFKLSNDIVTVKDNIPIAMLSVCLSMGSESLIMIFYLINKIIMVLKIRVYIL